MVDHRDLTLETPGCQDVIDSLATSQPRVPGS